MWEPTFCLSSLICMPYFISRPLWEKISLTLHLPFKTQPTSTSTNWQASKPFAIFQWHLQNMYCFLSWECSFLFKHLWNKNDQMLIADAARFSTLKGSKRSYLRSKNFSKSWLWEQSRWKWWKNENFDSKEEVLHWFYVPSKIVLQGRWQKKDCWIVDCKLSFSCTDLRAFYPV